MLTMVPEMLQLVGPTCSVCRIYQCFQYEGFTSFAWLHLSLVFLPTTAWLMSVHKTGKARHTQKQRRLKSLSFYPMQK